MRSNMFDGIGTFLIFMGIVCAVGGWAIIEGAIYVLNHIKWA